MTHNHRNPPDLLADGARSTVVRLAAALITTLAFVVFEALAGIYANSLALLTDAAHNLTDVAALALSWYALRASTRPASPSKTYGYHRAGILAALVNSSTLGIIALGVFYQAYRRIVTPVAVEEDVLIGVAVIAFLVNAGTAWLVRPGSGRDLNLRSAFVHLAGDTLSTVGAVVAGVLIKVTGWEILDPIVSILIAGLILWNAWVILRETVEILLEGAPRGLDVGALASDILRTKGVLGVHDLHVWSIAADRRAISAHILIEDAPLGQTGDILRRLNELLFHDYGIVHSTLQLECEECQPAELYCDLTDPEANHHRAFHANPPT
jgi:cobalt-zinc-cadmium efflux system protein